MWIAFGKLPCFAYNCARVSLTMSSSSRLDLCELEVGLKNSFLGLDIWGSSLINFSINSSFDLMNSAAGLRTGSPFSGSFQCISGSGLGSFPFLSSLISASLFLTIVSRSSWVSFSSEASDFLFTKGRMTAGCTVSCSVAAAWVGDASASSSELIRDSSI